MSTIMSFKCNQVSFHRFIDIMYIWSLHVNLIGINLRTKYATCFGHSLHDKCYQIVFYNTLQVP